MDGKQINQVIEEIYIGILELNSPFTTVCSVINAFMDSKSVIFFKKEDKKIWEKIKESINICQKK